MGQACTHDHFPPPDGEEHPVVAVLALVAIAAAMLLIAWMRLEVHGTRDIEAALSEPTIEVHPEPRSLADEQVDEAVAASRFATGLSP